MIDIIRSGSLSCLISAILAQEGQGYVQSKFLARCCSCHGKITKELLYFYKLVRDIVKEDRDGLEPFLA